MTVKMLEPNHHGSNVTARGIQALTDVLRVLRRVRHANIVLFNGAFTLSQHSLIAAALELVEPRLDILLVASPRTNPPGERARFTIMVGICLALWYLHAHHAVITHGDLIGRTPWR